jgi:WD40 repeat protein
VTASEDETAQIWDAESCLPLGEPLRHEGTVNSASFSSDGLRVVTASADGSARIWDAQSGRLAAEPLVHKEGVVAATFSADSRRVLTASNDKTARVWDVAVDLESPLPSWVPELAEALAERRLNDAAQMVRPARSIISLRDELLALGGDDFWSRLGRWFVTRGPQRTISPDSRITNDLLGRA